MKNNIHVVNFLAQYSIITNNKENNIYYNQIDITDFKLLDDIAKLMDAHSIFNSNKTYDEAVITYHKINMGEYYTLVEKLKSIDFIKNPPGNTILEKIANCFASCQQFMNDNGGYNKFACYHGIIGYNYVKNTSGDSIALVMRDRDVDGQMPQNVLPSDVKDLQKKLEPMQQLVTTLKQQLEASQHEIKSLQLKLTAVGQVATPNTSTSDYAVLQRKYDDLLTSYENKMQQVHLPGHWPHTELATPQVLYEFSSKTSSTCKSIAADMCRRIPEADRPRLKEIACSVLRVPPALVERLSGYLLCAVIVQEAFKMFERESFSAISSPRYDRSRETRTKYYHEYSTLMMTSSSQAWETHAPFREWADIKIDAIASLFGLNKDPIVPLLREGLKCVWCLQRLFQAVVVTPTIIYAAYNDPYDTRVVRNKDLDEDDDTDSEGNRGITAKERRAKRVLVTYTIFPGFHLDDATAVHCLVVVHPKQNALPLDK